jgi:hypothetical protein
MNFLKLPFLAYSMKSIVQWTEDEDVGRQKEFQIKENKTNMDSTTYNQALASTLKFHPPSSTPYRPIR